MQVLLLVFLAKRSTEKCVAMTWCECSARVVCSRCLFLVGVLVGMLEVLDDGLEKRNSRRH